eukprot:gene9624-biopygen677
MRKWTLAREWCGGLYACSTYTHSRTCGPWFRRSAIPLPIHHCVMPPATVVVYGKSRDPV